MRPWIQIPFSELAQLLDGNHKDYPQSFLKCYWIQDSSGFKVTEGVTFVFEGKKRNPRIINKLNFSTISNFKHKYIAKEGIKCKGTVKCRKPCPVQLKICYLINHQVDIYVKSSDHGENFVGELNVIPHHIRNDIRCMDDQEKAMGKIGVTPFSLYLQYSKKKEVQKSTPLPNKKMIENTLYYHRKAGSQKDPISELEDFINNSKNVIYPSKKENFPSNSMKNNNPVVILLAARQNTLIEFVRCMLLHEFFIWGMDSQFVNNNARLPLTVVCCQNERRKTIPAFVALSLKAYEAHYTLILQQVIAFLKDKMHVEFNRKGFLMIDKDAGMVFRLS